MSDPIATHASSRYFDMCYAHADSQIVSHAQYLLAYDKFKLDDFINSFTVLHKTLMEPIHDRTDSYRWIIYYKNYCPMHDENELIWFNYKFIEYSYQKMLCTLSCRQQL